MMEPPHSLSADEGEFAKQDSLPTYDNVSMTNTKGQFKPDSEPYGYLSAPAQRPLRPLSPDATSLLSADEYEQLSLSRRSSRTTQQLESRPVSLRGWRGRLTASWIRNKALALMLLAQMFGTSMNVLTRILEQEGNSGKGMHPFQVLFVRMLITVVLSMLYMYHMRTPHFPFGAPQVRWLLIARGLSGFFGVTGMYWSLLYLPLSDATVITFLAPGLIGWVGSKLLKEPFTRTAMIATLVSFVGVVFVAKPTSLFHAFGGPSNTPPAAGDIAFSEDGSTDTATDVPDSYDSVKPEQRLFAVGIALVGVAGTVVALTTIKWIGKRAHPLISVNYFAVWCTLVSFVMQIVLPDVGFVAPASWKEWGLLISLGLCGWIMQYLLAEALSYEKSSRVQNMAYTSMFFALGCDHLIFGHTPDTLSIIGSSLILSAAIAIALSQGETPVKEATHDGRTDEDQEARVGLLADTSHQSGPTDQEIHLATFR